MPAFSGRLSDMDISNVAAYVLKTAEEGWEWNKTHYFYIYLQ
jgi:mono/diheme cytochrome c family protein